MATYSSAPPFGAMFMIIDVFAASALLTIVQAGVVPPLCRVVPGRGNVQVGVCGRRPPP